MPKFTGVIAEAVWQSPQPREPDPESSPYVDKSTSDSNASRDITASEERAARNMVLTDRMPPGSRETAGKRALVLEPVTARAPVSMKMCECFVSIHSSSVHLHSAVSVT